jgi:hypothetical protein
MRKHGDIVFFQDVFHSNGHEVEALLKTTEGQAQVFFSNPFGRHSNPHGY